MLLRFQRLYVEPGIRVYSPGDEVDIAEPLAAAYIHHGFATPVLAVPALVSPVIETATRKPRRRETRQRSR